MRIHSTKKLLDELKIVPVTDEEEENPLFSWHANILTINRRKTVVLMNDQNRYIIVLNGLKAKDFQKFDVIVEDAIRQVFKAERISEEVIEQYIQTAGAISFHKTKNRSMTSRLNQACEHVWVYASELDFSKVINIEVGKKASRFLVGGEKIERSHPYEALFNDLEALMDKPIFNTDTAVMKVSMDLTDHSIWRRLVVPLDLTFNDLHQVLQIAFDWQDYHLHEFYSYDETQKSNRPKLNLVMNEEAFDSRRDDMEMELGEGVLLSDFIPPHTHMKYIYDFGDDWIHDIVIEEILTNQDISSPICLEGEGTAPPEDCGGEAGFNEFLKVINNPSHPEHDSMRDWANMQFYQEFNRNYVNSRLQKL